MQKKARLVVPVMLAVLFACLAPQRPDVAQALMLGHRTAANMEWRRALAWYATAQSQDPHDPAPLTAEAQIWLWQGKLDLANDAMAHAQRLGAQDAATERLAGDIAAARGESDVAQQHWERALARAPTGPDGIAAAIALVQSDLAQGHITINPLDAAWAVIMRVPVPVPALRLDQAIILLHRGEAAQARTLLAALPTSRPQTAYLDLAGHWRDLPSDWVALGGADLGASLPALAKATLLSTLPGVPDAGPGYAYLALAEIQLGQTEAARAAVGQALACAPADEATIGAQVLLALHDQSPQNALAIITSWEAHHASTAALSAIAIDAARLAGDSRAEEHARWDLALAAAPADQPDAWEGLGAFYLTNRLGRDDGQTAWVFQRLAGWPDDARALDLLGQWDLATGHADGAVNAWHAAIQRDPRNPWPHLHLGQFAQALGNRVQARTELQQAADLDPHGDLRASLQAPLVALGGSANS